MKARPARPGAARDPAQTGLVASLLATLLLVAVLLFSLGCYPKHDDPPVIRSGSMIEASLAAQAHLKERPGLRLWITSGTPSMEPLIQGRVYAVTERLPFSELRVGQIVVYSSASFAASPLLHRLVQKDRDGFIASGDNNPRSESWERVTDANYHGKVLAIYSWPQ